MIFEAIYCGGWGIEVPSTRRMRRIIRPFAGSGGAPRRGQEGTLSEVICDGQRGSTGTQVDRVFGLLVCQ